jgi:aminotransferase
MSLSISNACQCRRKNDQLEATAMRTPCTPSVFVADRLQNVPPSGIRRFFDLVSEIEDVISLGVGEPDFITPWHIRETCIHSIEHGETTYTSNYGLLELREEISRMYDQKHNVEYNPDSEALITTGVSEALDLAIRAIVNPGDEVIVSQPSYVAYVPSVIFAGGIPVPLSTTMENKFKITPEELEAAITDKTKALVFNYPNNPTGATMDRNDLEAIADIVVEHDLMAMTGFRLGYALGAPEIISSMMLIHQYTMLCAPVTAQIGAIEALRNGEAEMQKMVREYDRRRHLIVGGLNKIGLECFEPKGAFYAFPSIESTGLTSEEFAEKLLNEQKVAAVPGDAFGKSGEGFLRCAYAASQENIRTALDRIGKFVDGLK